MDYALEHINSVDIENKIINMIKLNDENITDVSVKKSNGNIYIETKKKSNGFLSKSFNLTSKYEGYIENNEKKIKKG